MNVLLLGSLSGTLLGWLMALLSLFLILLVLIQRGRGGGLTGALGGPGGQSAFGSKAGDTFTVITVVVAAIWGFSCAFTMWLLGTHTPSTTATGPPAVQPGPGDQEQTTTNDLLIPTGESGGLIGNDPEAADGETDGEAAENTDDAAVDELVPATGTTEAQPAGEAENGEAAPAEAAEPADSLEPAGPAEAADSAEATMESEEPSADAAVENPDVVEQPAGDADPSPTPESQP